MATTEMIAKANEKRINALEKKLDAFEKDFRKSGDMSGLIKRVNTLETAVKALVVTSKSSGAKDNDVAREIGNLKGLIAKREDKIDKLRHSFDPDAVKKIANLEKRREILEKTVTALNGKAERDNKEFSDRMNKLNDELQKQAKKMAETAILEGRLKALESMVHSALSKR